MNSQSMSCRSVRRLLAWSAHASQARPASRGSELLAMVGATCGRYPATKDRRARSKAVDMCPHAIGAGLLETLASHVFRSICGLQVCESHQRSILMCTYSSDAQSYCPSAVRSTCLCGWPAMLLTGFASPSSDDMATSVGRDFRPPMTHDRSLLSWRRRMESGARRSNASWGGVPCSQNVWCYIACAIGM